MTHPAEELICPRALRFSSINAIDGRASAALVVTSFTFHIKGELRRAVLKRTVLGDDERPPLAPVSASCVETLVRPLSQTRASG